MPLRRIWHSARYQSCHTGVADFRIHLRRPYSRLAGAAVSGRRGRWMPSGWQSPRMPVGQPGNGDGTASDSYDVLLLKSDGSSEVYAQVDGPG